MSDVCLMQGDGLSFIFSVQPLSHPSSTGMFNPLMEQQGGLTVRKGGGKSNRGGQGGTEGGVEAG